MLYLSPSLLNDFYYYQVAGDEYVDIKRRELLDKLNGIRITTASMQRGIDFENLLRNYVDWKVPLDEKDAISPIVEEMAGYVRGGIWQEHVKTQILPNVIVHGYVDVINGNTVFDIKTTSRYDFPKFLHSCQHLVYLAALNSSEILKFSYLITDFSSVFVETYHWQDSMLDELRGHVNNFLNYLKIDLEMSQAFFRKQQRSAREYAA